MAYSKPWLELKPYLVSLSPLILSLSLFQISKSQTKFLISIVTMTKATVELDFFAMAAEKHNHTNHFTRNSTFRGIQSAISKINPALLRRVIATGGIRAGPPAIPIFNPNSSIVPENSPPVAPITIFYNGTVSVFDVNQDTAENIIQMAGEESLSDRMRMLEHLHCDLPQARKKSLQRFLEKRKERLTALGPYGKEQGEDMGFIATRNV